MAIDWQKAAEAYQTEILADLKTLLKINSERDVAHASDDSPTGPGPSKALEAFLAIATRDGFDTLDLDHVVGRIALGSGDEIFGLFGHVDVVPAGTGWVTDPYTPTLRDGKLYARGVADDKGPSIAAYYALKLLRDAGVPLHKRIHFIIDTDEETNWTGLHRYFKDQPIPDLGFSPDGQFPVLNAEKGISSIIVTFKSVPDRPATLRLEHFQAGSAMNVVPQYAEAVISGALPQDLQAQLTAYCTAHHVTATLTGAKEKVTIRLTGKAAHVKEPADGLNAGTYLAAFLAPFAFDAQGAQYLQTIARYFHQDTRGHHLKIAYRDDVMGELTQSPDLFSYEPGGAQTVLTNLRYPKGVTIEALRKQIVTTLGPERVSARIRDNKDPHYVGLDDPLVKTLLDVYTAHTGKPGYGLTYGGGTLARSIPRGVAYGPKMPEDEEVVHQANEYMRVSDLIQATAIYADALYRLTK
ncbi:dipeptidase PepV [Lacticaseibacillus camelliae]|nr:dipeptidase PepV [Lacticaseibacillus camelliae]